MTIGKKNIPLTPNRNVLCGLTLLNRIYVFNRNDYTREKEVNIHRKGAVKEYDHHVI